MIDFLKKRFHNWMLGLPSESLPEEYKNQQGSVIKLKSELEEVLENQDI